MKAVLCTLCLVALPAVACVNDYVTNTKATQDSANIVLAITKHDVAEPWAQREARLLALIAPTPEERNDLASALLHTGDTRQAIPILEQIEREVPGRYQTASNLGTACELAGQNEKALWWIQEGIRRNPESHEGSEWIHVAVLEKKVEFAGHGYPEEVGSILGIDEALARLPAGNRGEPLTRAQVIAGLRHQLHERIAFVPAPDYFVAALLFDLGRLYAREKGSPAASYGLYRLADEYGEGSGKRELSRLQMEAMVSRNHYPTQAERLLIPTEGLGVLWLALTPFMLLLRALRFWNKPVRRKRELLKVLACSATMFSISWIGWYAMSWIGGLALLAVPFCLLYSMEVARRVGRAFDRGNPPEPPPPCDTAHPVLPWWAEETAEG